MRLIIGHSVVPEANLVKTYSLLEIVCFRINIAVWFITDVKSATMLYVTSDFVPE